LTYGGCGANVSTSGSAYNERLISGVMSLGLTRNQAAGILGNMLSEGGHPATYEEEFRGDNVDIWDSANQVGIGLVQWSFGRRVTLLERVQAEAPDLMWIYENGMTDNSGRSESINSMYISYDTFVEKVGGDAVVNQLYAVELGYLAAELGPNGLWHDYTETDYDSPTEAAYAFYYGYERNYGGSTSLGATWWSETAKKITTDPTLWKVTYKGTVHDNSKRGTRAEEIAPQLSDTFGGYGACSLKAGGMTAEQAQAWLDATGYNDSSNDIHRVYNLAGWNTTAPDTFCQSTNGAIGSRDNCSGFSKYFITAWTSLTVLQVNGGKFAHEVVNSNPGANVSFGSEPRPYSIFSFGTSSGAYAGYGHTGLVIGVDAESGQLVTVEAGCGNNAPNGPGPYAKIRTDRTVDSMKNIGAEFAYVEGFLTQEIGQ
jgi:hypothetical protein